MSAIINFTYCRDVASTEDLGAAINASAKGLRSTTFVEVLSFLSLLWIIT